MFFELKIRKIGGSLGIILPKEALAHLNVKPAEPVFLTDLPDGSFRISSRGMTSAKMDVIKSISARYANALRELG
jgi:putative addiction module antidote